MSLRRALPMIAVAFGCAGGLAAESHPAKIERIAACRTDHGIAGVEMIAQDAPADRVRDRVVAATGIRLVHGDLIGPGKVTFGFHECLPLRAALSLLASAGDGGMAETLVDADGSYRLAILPHHAEIEHLLEQAADLPYENEAGRRALLEKVIALSAPSSKDEAEEFVSNIYAELAEMATAHKDYARAEALGTARVQQFERLGATDDPEYGIARADLAYARLDLHRDGAVAELESALQLLQKHPGDAAWPAAARAASNLEREAAAAEQFDRVESFSTLATQILTRPDSASWDADALKRARSVNQQVETYAAMAYMAPAREADAARHFERALRRGEEFQPAEPALAFAREMVATVSEDPAALEDVAAFYAKQHVEPGKTPTVDQANGLWALALVRVKQQRWDDAIAAWQRVRQMRAQLCPQDHAAERAGAVDLELIQALSGKPAAGGGDHALDAAASPDAASAFRPATATTDACSGGVLGHALTQDLSLLLVEHYQRLVAASRDGAARQRAETGLMLSHAAARKSLGLERKPKS